MNSFWISYLRKNIIPYRSCKWCVKNFLRKSVLHWVKYRQSLLILVLLFVILKWNLNLTRKQSRWVFIILKKREREGRVKARGRNLLSCHVKPYQLEQERITREVSLHSINYVLTPWKENSLPRASAGLYSIDRLPDRKLGHRAAPRSEARAQRGVSHEKFIFFHQTYRYVNFA